jgi:hypothetical protein
MDTSDLPYLNLGEAMGVGKCALSNTHLGAANSIREMTWPKSRDTSDLGHINRMSRLGVPKSVLRGRLTTRDHPRKHPGAMRRGALSSR